MPSQPILGHRGGVISMHRAFTHYQLDVRNLLTAFSLCLLFLVLWLLFLPHFFTFLSRSIALGLDYLPLRAGLAVASYRFGFLRLEIPFLRMDPVLPTFATWATTCVATLLLFAGTFLLSQKFLPVAYLARAVLGVQATALVYFVLWPSRFPVHPDSYMQALTASGAAMITAIPVLFGLTYYIFDFGLSRKLWLTSLTMIHLGLFLPFQILLQAMVLQKSVLFMPLLYIIGGMPVEVLLIIGFYSWGMSWAFQVSPA